MQAIQAVHTSHASICSKAMTGCARKKRHQVEAVRQLYAWIEAATWDSVAPRTVVASPFPRSHLAFYPSTLHFTRPFSSMSPPQPGQLRTVRVNLAEGSSEEEISITTGPPSAHALRHAALGQALQDLLRPHWIRYDTDWMAWCWRSPKEVLELPNIPKGGP